MTAVTALVDNGKIFMGADSAGVDAHSLELGVRKDEKVFYNGSMLIGCTTSFRMIGLLKYSFYPPGHPEGMPAEEYMNRYFVESVRKCFSDFGFTSGDFIVGYKGNIYGIWNDFQVAVPVDPYLAVGGGSDLCLGSMYSTIGQPPETRIRTALEAAERFNAGVRAPFVIKSL